MKSSSFMFFAILLCLGLLLTTSDAEYFSDLSTFTELVIITAQVQGTGFSPFVASSQAIQAVANVLGAVSPEPYIAQFAADPQDLLDDNWGTVSALVTAQGEWNYSLIPTYLEILPYNFSISYEVISNFNASVCAVGNYSSLNSVQNLISVDDPTNCGPIDQTAYYPCTSDADCVEGSVCVTTWMQGSYITYDWCVPEAAQQPYVTASLQLDVSLEDADPEQNLVAVNNAISTFVDSWGCGSDFAISTNDTSLEQNATVEVTLTVFGATVNCQGYIDTILEEYFVYTYVNKTCIDDVVTVSSLLYSTIGSIPTAVNDELQCGLVNAGFAPCNSTLDCTDGYQCGAADIVNQANVLACQLDLQTNFYSFNISIAPTAANPQPKNYTINYLYLNTLIDQLQEYLEDNDCLAIDSAQASYIPQAAPYHTAAVFATHLNTSDACTIIDLNQVANSFMLLATADSDALFNVSVEATQSDVSVADCVTSSGDIILAGTCGATADVTTDTISTCTTDADCASKQTCTAISADQNICLAQNDNGASHIAMMSATIMVVIALIASSMA